VGRGALRNFARSELLALRPAIRLRAESFPNCASRGPVVYPSERLERFSKRPDLQYRGTSPATGLLQLGRR